MGATANSRIWNLADTATGLYLDSNYGTNGLGSIYTREPNGGDWQKWVFVKCTCTYT